MTFEHSNLEGDRPTIAERMQARLSPARIKLQATIGMERLFFPIFVTGLIIMFIGFSLGPGRRGFRVVDHETSMMIGFGIGGGVMVLAGLLWLLIDNYYVVDRPTRRILVHRGFRFFGADFPFLEASQVSALGLNCVPVQGKYGQKGWRFTPVLLTFDGREIELASTKTDMECGELGELNYNVQQWAAVLQRPWIECPPRQEFNVRYHLDMAGEVGNSASLV